MWRVTRLLPCVLWHPDSGEQRYGRASHPCGLTSLGGDVGPLFLGRVLVLWADGSFGSDWWGLKKRKKRGRAVSYRKDWYPSNWIWWLQWWIFPLYYSSFYQKASPSFSSKRSEGSPYLSFHHHHLVLLQVCTQQTCQLVRLAPCVVLGVPDQLAASVGIIQQALSSGSGGKIPRQLYHR